jgi:hypothetical protein
MIREGIFVKYITKFKAKSLKFKRNSKKRLKITPAIILAYNLP